MVLLSETKSIEAYRNDRMVMRGRFFDKTGYHEKESLKAFDCGIETEEDFVSRLSSGQSPEKAINGQFFVVLETKTHIFAAVDRVTTFPLYYTKFEDDILISDSIALINDKMYQTKIDTISLSEFRASGFILHNRTMYKNINKLQAGQYLMYDKNSKSLYVKDYFLHLHRNIYNLSENELCQELDKVVGRIFERTITHANGRPIVLFLSGGYDSRLVLVNLKKLKYENVICVSYGSKNYLESNVAQKIAKELGYPWIFIHVSKKYWRNIRNNNFIAKRLLLAAKGVSYPYISGILLEDLVNAGTIPSNAIVITGNSGDVVEGADVSGKFMKGVKYKKQDIIEVIKYNHFHLDGLKNHTSEKFDDEISKYIPDQAFFTDEECEEYLEFANWRMRQSQYVVNDVRNYDDYLGLDWALPLWDDEFVDFWLKVPYELRFKRKLYYKYVMGERLPSANHTTSLPRKIINAAKITVFGIVKHLYGVKVLYQFAFCLPTWLSGLGLAYFSEFWDILKRTKGYRMDVGCVLVYLILKHNIHVDYRER